MSANFRSDYFTLDYPFPDLIEMARESMLLEWYSIMDDQCFISQLHQAVSISLFQFYLMKFGNQIFLRLLTIFPNKFIIFF